MTKKQVLGHIEQIGILPVLRASSSEDAIAMAAAIAMGGISIVEVTMTVPNATSVIRALIRDMQGLLVGAGTVCDSETAKRCIDAGAQFIVSPSTDTDVIELCNKCDIAILPGALTPTEIVHAWRAGADAVKVFPASAMGGAAYIRSVRAPLPHLKLVPSGGITLATIRDYVDAGSWAVSAGSQLADASTIAEGRPEVVTRTAQAYLAALRDSRAR